jgi:hypothetical protein
VVLNKFDTGRKRLSSGIRDLYSGGLVAAKLTVRASPHFTLKACPLHKGIIVNKTKGVMVVYVTLRVISHLSIKES